MTQVVLYHRGKTVASQTLLDQESPSDCLKRYGPVFHRLFPEREVSEIKVQTYIGGHYVYETRPDLLPLINDALPQAPLLTLDG